MSFAGTSIVPLAPSTGTERVELIDALRGFALAGVLLMNLGEFTLINYLSHPARMGLPTAAFDRWAEPMLELLVQGKALTMFSLLFGLGFAVQLERAQHQGILGIQLYVRRVVILFGIGIAHSYLLWQGDILRIYALLALLMIPLRHLSDRALLWAGLFVALLLPSLLAPWMDVLQASQLSDRDMNARTLSAFSASSYAEAMRHNAVYAHWDILAGWGVFPFVLGRFLIGYWIGRKHLLLDPYHHRDLLERTFAACLAIGLVTTVWWVTRDSTPGIPISEQATRTARVLGRVVSSTGSLALGLAYVAGFALLYLLPAWRRALSVLAPVGRMALTNYLAQTAICMAIFYGFGLGIGPRFGYAGSLIVWCLLFTGQILLSHWWLKRYRFGPAEWLWRSLTYAQWQPIRKPQTMRGETA